jgi:hypothetical protein
MLFFRITFLHPDAKKSSLPAVRDESLKSLRNNNSLKNKLLFKKILSTLFLHPGTKKLAFIKISFMV